MAGRTWIMMLALSAAPASALGNANRIFESGFASIEAAGLEGTLAVHNYMRAAVRVPLLQWDPALAASSQSWADQCVDIQPPAGVLDYNPQRSTGFPWYVGENLMSSGSPLTGRYAAWYWASQESAYDPATGQCTEYCVDYTQMVWSTTQFVGCGIAVCPSLAFGHSIVCDYGPGRSGSGPAY